MRLSHITDITDASSSSARYNQMARDGAGDVGPFPSVSRLELAASASSSAMRMASTSAARAARARLVVAARTSLCRGP